MLESLERADQDATLAINTFSSPFMDGFWSFFSDRLVWIPLYLLLAVLLFVRLGWRKALVALVVVGLTILLADRISVLVKGWAERLRPCWDERMLSRGLRVLEGRGGKYGFFSSHAANALGLALCTLGCMKLRSDRRFNGCYGTLVVVWALLVALSRIFVGKHFLGDVLVGLLAGGIIGLLMSRLARFVVSRAGWQGV